MKKKKQFQYLGKQKATHHHKLFWCLAINNVPRSAHHKYFCVAYKWIKQNHILKMRDEKQTDSNGAHESHILTVEVTDVQNSSGNNSSARTTEKYSCISQQRGTGTGMGEAKNARILFQRLHPMSLSANTNWIKFTESQWHWLGKNDPENRVRSNKTQYLGTLTNLLYKDISSQQAKGYLINKYVELGKDISEHITHGLRNGNYRGASTVA